jgi:hypothetical protein
MVEPVTIASAAVGAIVTLIQFLNSLVGEAWTRYFILLAGLSAVNAIENVAGIYAVEGLLSYVVANVFGVQGFAIPVYYGVSSLVILTATLPFVFYLLKHTVFDID